MILALKFLLAVAALVLPGEALLRWLAPGCRWGWCRPLVAFGIGQGVAMWCVWVLGMAGVPMWSWGIALVLTASVVVLWLGRRRSGMKPVEESPGLLPEQTTKPGFPAVVKMRRGMRYLATLREALPWLILILAAWVLTVQAAEEALAHRIGSVPGMGNWAFKTKLLLMTESWPADFFEYEAHNRRMGYPPGFPLLCGWCAAFMGGLETHAIRLLPVFLTTGTFLLAGTEVIRRRRWWGLPGVAALLALFLGYPGRGVLSHFYAEPLLLFTAAVTVVTLGSVRGNPGRLAIGLLAAGCMAWTKNEGVVGFFLIAGSLFVFAESTGTTRRAVVVRALWVAGAMILPWRIYLAAHGWSDESFAWDSFVGEGRWERLDGAWEEYRQAMFQHGAWMGAAWWILPLLVWFAFQRSSGMLPTLTITAAGWVAVAVVMMMGSAEEDFAWHARAAPRVLLCPSLLLLMGYAHIGMNQKKTGT